MSDIKKINIFLRANLSENRFLHSIRTSETAEKLCILYGQDAEKGMIAGLIHDIARELEDNQIMELVKNDGYVISPLEKEYPILLHGRAGAVLAQEKLSIDNEIILDAVRWHTTGKANMGKLSSILYVADYIEPGRTHLSKDFRQNTKDLKLDNLVMLIVKDSISYCRKKGYSVAEQTLMLYHDLEKKVS